MNPSSGVCRNRWFGSAWPVRDKLIGNLRTVSEQGGGDGEDWRVGGDKKRAARCWRQGRVDTCSKQRQETMLFWNGSYFDASVKIIK